MKSDNKRKGFPARALAIILSILMVLSIAFYTVYMIVEEVQNKKKANEKKDAAIEEVVPPVAYLL